MGGGGAQENISGTLNGVDITSIEVWMSSDLSAGLTNYPTGVEQGTYGPSLIQVQAMFSGLTWGAPTKDTTQTVIVQAAPNQIGYTFFTNTAHLFQFEAADVQAVPEPSTVGLVLCGGALLALGRQSSKQQ